MEDKSVVVRFNEIYDSTSRAVLLFVTAKCPSVFDAQDIVQDTYLEVYRLLEKRGADYIKNDRAIVLKIARQKLYKYYTAAERLKMLFSSSVDENEPELSDFDAEAFCAEDFAVDAAALSEIKALIQNKPQDTKRVFYLFYGLDFTIPEIAKALNISQSNVKHKLYRTVAEIRKALNETK